MISIVIPTINRPSLQAAIGSARAQDCDIMTDIIVCGDSTRSGVMGASENRNIAAEKAKGEWLAFLDDDDVWHGDYLRKAFESPADVIINSDADGFQFDVNNLESYLSSGLSFPGSGLIIKKSVFPGFDAQMQHSEIWALLCDLLKAGVTFAHVNSKAWTRGRQTGYHAGELVPCRTITDQRQAIWAGYYAK
jgi:glycosyltransferase involved in cell wall biosynthesis